MSTLRVLLADDHALVRAELRSLLADLPDVVLVGEASNGYEALELIEQAAPDLALVDVSMPGLNGLEVVARVREAQARTRVVIVSMHAEPQFVHTALAAGAAGYLLKDTDRAEYARALRALARGETWISEAARPQPSRA